MRKSIYLWQLIGFVFTGVLGVLLHFLYDWTQNGFVALFSAVNESIWEHMKLLFVPMIIFAFIEGRHFDKKYENFWCAKLFGILTGLILIPILYYTYTGVLGVSADWFNIAIFFIAAAVSYALETRLIKSGMRCLISPATVKAVVIFIAVIFVIFTFVPPTIPLFEDPTATRGLLAVRS